MNCAMLPSSRPGATAVRSACNRTCSTGDGRWVLIASSAADGSAVASKRRRPAVLSAPRPVIPSHSASRSTAAVTASMISARRIGLRQRMRADQVDQLRCLAFGQCGQLGQHVAAQLTHGRIDNIGAEGVDGAAATGGSRAHEVRRPTRGQPGPAEPDPTACGRSLLPLVVPRGWGPHRLQRRVVGQKVCGISHLDDEGGMCRVNIEEQRQPLEIAHREATGTQDPRWTRAPVRCDLVHEAEQLGGLAPGRGIHRGLFVGDDRQVGCGQRGLTVKPVPAQPQGDLAGQGHVVGGQGADQLM